MLKQETFYEVQSWGCVSALLGLPAELIPHMFGFVSCDVNYYTSMKGRCQHFFRISCEVFAEKSSPAGGEPAGARWCVKNQALVYWRSKICGATLMSSTAATTVSRVSGSM